MSWTPMRSYRGASRRAVSLPVGGIGTGTIGFGGRGQFRDWEVENHPAKGQSFGGTFFACRFAEPGADASAAVLEGRLFDEEVEGALGSGVPLAGMKRFEECVFETAYPFGRVVLKDAETPIEATVEAWNPLVPGDEEASGLPMAVYEVTMRSRKSVPLGVSVMLSLEDIVGHRYRSHGKSSVGGGQTNGAWVQVREPSDLRTVVVGDHKMDPTDEEWGTLAAAVLGTGTFAGTRWSLGQWNQGLTAMWEGFVRSGVPAEGNFRPGPGEPTNVCLGAERLLEPLGATTITFVLAWHFPNRHAWSFTGPGPRGGSTADIIGNYYCTRFSDAYDVIERTVPRLSELRRQTEDFVGTLIGSDLASVVKEAALFNLSTLRSQTFFRSADGRPYGWEGCLDDAGCCPGSCTHVWNYEYATPYLYPRLAKVMREVEFLHATSDVGAMSFRVMLPLDTDAQSWGLAAADGQYGRIVSLHREWRNSGDGEFLRRLWPACKRAMSFSWLPGSWDADEDGVAEGCLHNTMDVEYYGPTSIIQGWYLGALGAAAEMAGAVGDDSFAAHCRELREKGAEWTDTHLFNGSYYQQDIRPPKDFESLRPEVRHPDMGAHEAAEPEYQIGDGCLIDQLAGEAAAVVAGVGPSLARDHVLSALESIHRLNYVDRLGRWKNYMRTFGTGDDEGHVMVAYPAGLPAHPMPYWSEVMTGFEYTYALSLVQTGRREFAEAVTSMVRRRYDGRTRNPFDEAECGHHYARAMASWGLVHAFGGIDYDGRAQEFILDPVAPDGRWFWAVNGAWGILVRGPERVDLEVHSGCIDVSRVRIGDDDLAVPETGSFGPGQTVSATRS